MAAKELPLGSEVAIGQREKADAGIVGERRDGARRLADWLEKQPPEEAYDFTCPGTCALARWMTSTDLSPLRRRGLWTEAEAPGGAASPCHGLLDLRRRGRFSVGSGGEPRAVDLRRRC